MLTITHVNYNNNNNDGIVIVYDLPTNKYGTHTHT